MLEHCRSCNHAFLPAPELTACPKCGAPLAAGESGDDWGDLNAGWGETPAPELIAPPDTASAGDGASAAARDASSASPRVDREARSAALAAAAATTAGAPTLEVKEAPQLSADDEALDEDTPETARRRRRRRSRGRKKNAAPQAAVASAPRAKKQRQAKQPTESASRAAKTARSDRPWLVPMIVGGLVVAGLLIFFFSR
ncbi:MAG: zinc ribbon domain-containing protein [Deltaproteobacteria bacterium]|nr:zinc ribbon domain-containing protein [Deltaproteobacteria bacterium]